MLLKNSPVPSTIKLLLVFFALSILLRKVSQPEILSAEMAAMRPSKLFDVLTADVKLLQALLSNGSTNSVDLVEAYINQIRKHDDYLHAMLSMPPVQDLKATARALDEERQRGSTRGPLHGIPIILKDNIATHPSLGMETTAGSLALRDSRPRENAKIVDMLIAAGAIVLGKANLSELSNYKGHNITYGWSAVGGQTQSAYVRGGLDPDDSVGGHSNPSGSSSGSAVGASAGYAPFSIGTETDGSLVGPAGRAGLYTMKPTIGLVPQDGVVPVSHTFDSAGPMTKTPYDLAVLLDAITVKSTGASENTSYTASLNGSWSELSVAAVSYDAFNLPPDVVKPVKEATVQMKREYHAALEKITSKAKRFVENVPLISTNELEVDGVNSRGIVKLVDFARDLPAYLEKLEYSGIRTLEELVEFNREHADKELPPGHSNQHILEAAHAVHVSPKQYESYFKHMRTVGRERGIDYVLHKYDVDIMLGPSDGVLSTLASASGYPIATMPLGYLEFNGRPFGLCALAGAHQEATLIRAQSAWEEMFGPRLPPPALAQ